MITAVNERRHRARFRAWTAYLAAQLKRRGARLIVDAPYGARMDGFPHLDVEAVGEGDATFTLKVGRGVSLGRHTHLDLWAGGTNRLEFGDGSYLMHGVRIQLRGGSIRLGAFANIRDGVVLKSEGELSIGYEVPVSYGGMIHCVRRIDIEDRAGLAERVTVVDSDHSHYGTDEYFLATPLRIDPVRIRSNAFICANAVILRGAAVGANSVVGAGAVVGAGEHPAGWLLAGAPARPVRPLAQAVTATGSSTVE